MYNETLRFRTKITETEATGRMMVSTMAFAQSFQKATSEVDNGLSEPGARKIAAYISRVCRCRAKEVNRHRHDESKMKAQAVRQNILIFYCYCLSSLEKSQVMKIISIKGGRNCYRHVNSCTLSTSTARQNYTHDCSFINSRPAKLSIMTT